MLPSVVSDSQTAESENLSQSKPKGDSSIVILDDEEDGSEPNSSVSEIPKDQAEENNTSPLELGMFCGRDLYRVSNLDFILECPEECPVKDIINLVDKPVNNRCINTNCEGNSSEFIFAPDFCLSSFR